MQGGGGGAPHDKPVRLMGVTSSRLMVRMASLDSD